jgi:CarD family transcriptional regulator
MSLIAPEELQFAKGEMVVHPKLGVGEIVNIEEREPLVGYSRYYVVDILSKQLIVRVPVRNAAKIGMRPVMSAPKLDLVFQVLGSLPGELPTDYKERQAIVDEKLKTFKPLPVAEAVRDLYWHGKADHLTQADAQLLERGRELLESEIAAATGSDRSEIMNRVDSALHEWVDTTPVT